MNVFVLFKWSHSVFCITLAKFSLGNLLTVTHNYKPLGAIVTAVVYGEFSTSGRALLCSWLLLSMVMTATYTGKLTSNSMVIQQPLPFSTLSELVKRTDYSWGVRRGTMVESMLSVRWFCCFSRCRL